MADPALILMQGETSLIPAGVNAASNGMGQGFASNVSGENGRFSGMLQARMSTQSPAGVSKLDGESPVSQNSTGKGVVSPLSGKLLPGHGTNSDFGDTDTPHGLTDATGMSVLSLLYGQANTARDGKGVVGSDGLMDDSLLAIEGEASEQAGLLALAQQTLTSQTNSPQSTSADRQLVSGQMPLAWNAPTQAGNGAETMQSPLLSLVEDENALQRLAPLSGQFNRPLNANERMALEQARLPQSQQSVSVLADGANSGLTRHILTAAGNEARRSAVDGAMLGVSMTQNRFGEWMDQALTQNSSSTPSVDATQNSSLLSSIQRATGGMPMPSINVATPVGQPGWATEMGQRVTWMANSELREAQIQLNPRHLGPVEVKISFGHEQQLNVTFTAAHQVTREALDAALPRLREMFEQQGMNLADANVSREAFAEHKGTRQQGSEEDDGVRATNVGQSLTLHHENILANDDIPLGLGLIDAYA